MKGLLKGFLVLFSVWGVALTVFFLYVWFGTASFDHMMMNRISPYICTLLFDINYGENVLTELGIKNEEYIIYQQVGKKFFGGENGVCPTYEGVLWRSGVKNFEQIKIGLDSMVEEKTQP